MCDIQTNYPSDAARLYFEELSSQIVAETGIPSDRHHLGKLLLRNFKEDPGFVSQINGYTGETETNQSILKRSVQCAISLKNVGVKVGDVVTIMAPNHLDVYIPFYASFYIGAAASGADRTLGVYELTHIFSTNKPKIIFCQTEKLDHIEKALEASQLDTLIVTFDADENKKYMTFNEFIKNNVGKESIEDFKATDFDTADTIAYLIATSGTTGMAKSAAITHKNLCIGSPIAWCNFTRFPTPTPLILNQSPLQWLSAALHVATAPLYKVPLLLTPLALTQDHFYHLLEKYKPSYVISSPVLMTHLLKPSAHNPKHLTCFEVMLIGGGPVPNELLQHIKKISPKTVLLVAYGASEASTFSLFAAQTSSGHVFRPMGIFKYRLVNCDTQEDVLVPNVQGELWLKGPTVFKGYMNQPKATAEVLTEDGWLKSGDIFYRDDNWNFFFVERQKLLLKYMTYHVSPTEVESVIRTHPGVLDVVIGGIPNTEYGDIPLAFVVPRPDVEVNAQDIKDLVKEKLADSKQLRGGVHFMPELPLTSTGKVDRVKIKSLIMSMHPQKSLDT